jgi:hypothetical protein
MALDVLLEYISPQLVREGPYIRELAGLILAGRKQAVSIAYDMEKEIVDYDGFPPGSFNIYMSLVELFPQVEWEMVIAALERNTPGAAYSALRLIEAQRVFKKSGVAIVYTIVKCNPFTVFTLHTVNLCGDDRLDFLAKMEWVYP